MNNERGFSLVELLISLAIVGMLASMAITNYQLFAAKARQVEAKMALSGMFAAEQAFYAEFNSYTDCLNQAGYSPSGKTRFYSTGQAGNDTFTCFGGNSCYQYNSAPPQWCDGTCESFASGTGDTSYQETVTADLPLINTCDTQASAGLPNSWTVYQNSFILGAGGSISSSPLYDMWQIDNNQNFSNIQNGL